MFHLFECFALHECMYGFNLVSNDKKRRKGIRSSILRRFIDIASHITMLRYSVINIKKTFKVSSFNCQKYLFFIQFLACSNCFISIYFHFDFSFKNGPKPLSQLMRESMASDPAAPILWEAHLQAMDRRVNILLNTFRKCIELNTVEDVLYSRDNFGE